ncbi:MAG: restriction endonuclease [Bacteroidota bacterium]|jgi:hypothetical protein
MTELKSTTASEAGPSGDTQVRLALQVIHGNGGVAEMPAIYSAVEAEMRKNGFTLSIQGKASLRFYVNRVAIKAGFVFPYDKNNPGWRITQSDQQLLAEPPHSQENLFSVVSGKEERADTNVARGTAFEFYVLDLLKSIYPFYTWYHQGIHKHIERGLDFIGTRVGDVLDSPKNIGVQVKFHQEKFAPRQEEWLKFLSGCFARQIEKAIFITTGQLTSEQHHEAQEANVTVIEGRKEIARIAKLYKMKTFELFKE